MNAYKFLRADGTGVFTRFAWPLPDGGPGAWVETEPDPCRAGVHACRLGDLPYWAGRTLYEIELEGDVVEHKTKVVAARGRLLRCVEAWDEAFRTTYTRFCAARGSIDGGADGAVDLGGLKGNRGDEREDCAAHAAPSEKVGSW